MENTKPKITSKQLGMISYQIFRNHWEDERFKKLIDQIPRRTKKVGTQIVVKTISDFERFLKENFDIAEASLFIQKIMERDINGLINILKVKNYNFRKVD